MHSVKKWLADQPMNIKLFIFAALLIVTPLLTVGLIAHYWSAVELENEARDYSWEVIDQVEAHIEYYIRDFEINSLKIMNHPDIVQLVAMKSTEEVTQSNIRPAIESLLKNIAYSRPDISNITVVVDNVQVIDVMGSRSPYPVDELTKEYWYQSVLLNSSPLLISRMIEWPDHKEPVISLVRRIYNPRTLEPVGMLIIDINFRRLKEIADKVYVRQGGYFYILDLDGHYVYHPNASNLGKKMSYVDHDLLDSKGNGWFIADNENHDFITFSYSSYLGWHFITSIPYQQLIVHASQFGQIIFWAILSALSLAYLLGVVFAAKLMQPIRELQNFMKKVEVGDFSVRIEVKSRDELGQLARGFNKMVKKLAQMMEEIYFSRLRETENTLRQKEMEIKVLQSQMNPHFLCNSLETIRGMALYKGNEDIAAMAVALGRLLRYNLKNQEHIVNLREEVKFCQVYLQIQQFRFDNQFEYSIDIPEWANSLQFVKFSLQPLVENCFVHGFGSTAVPLHIRISVFKETEDAFIVRVIDNGVGINRDVLDKIRQDLAEQEIIDGGQSIGIVNVHRRIMRLYDQRFGLAIDSNPGKGTIVTLRLPIISMVERE